MEGDGVFSMNSVYSTLFPEELFAEEYRNQDEYLSDLIKQAELILNYYVACTKTLDDTMDKIKGIVITKEQVDRTFRNNESIDEYQKGVKKEFDKSSFFIRQRLKNTEDEGKLFAIEYIKKVYRLAPIEMFFLILSIMPYIDSKYEKVYAFLQDDVTKRYMSYDLAFKLYFFVNDVSQINDYYIMKNNIMDKMSSLCFVRDTMVPDNRLVSFILTNGNSKINIKGVSCYLPKEKCELSVMEGVSQKISNVIDSRADKDEPIFFNISGCSTSGKRTQVERVGQITDNSIVMVDLEQISRETEFSFYDSLMTSCRESMINQGYICFYNCDILLNEEAGSLGYMNLILNVSRKFSTVVFILSKKAITNREIKNDRLWISVQIPDLTKEESIFLWNELLQEIPIEEDIQAFEMANKFSFTAGQIRGTIEEAKKLLVWNQSDKISRKDICKCAYTQVIHNLEEKATLIYAKHNWDQLVLAKDQKEMLKNACDQIRYKHIVYDNWGFEKRLAYGRGVSMLFAGPPGTGKTMAAQVVANDLDIEIYKVDLSKIVSKYIGETEKNLDKLFNEAKKSNVILFFDETDALLGKRTEVKDSHDKNANLETSYLLQKMEEYDGITVMSTNYVENIDTAFFRRISYVIHFPFPDVASRKMIWQKMFPAETPLDDDVDFDYLAEQFEIAGGNIKNIAVTAAFLAAEAGNKVKMEHILKAIKYELTKQGKIVLKEDFGEHGYMI